MAQQMRMFRTLACLGGAMTGTALLLGWLNPARGLSTMPLTPDEAWSLAWSAVADELAAPGAAWTAVDVVADAAPAAALLAAAADDGAWHFEVTRDGRPCRGRLWGNQHSLDRYPGVVRIRLPQTWSETDPPPSQIVGLRALLGVLHDWLAPSGSTLPVRMIPLPSITDTASSAVRFSAPVTLASLRAG